MNIAASDLVTDIQVTIEGRKSDVKNTSIQDKDSILAVSGSQHQSRNVYIIIVVPIDSYFDYEASILSGSVVVNSLHGKEFTILSDNGDISFGDIQSESIEITANNGMVNIDNVHNGNHHLKSDSGTIIVTNSSGEHCLLKITMEL